MSPILGIYASQISGHLFAPSGAYDSIATATVGAGGASSITFSSIPSTYTHLQIRGIGRTAWANPSDQVRIQANGDTTSANYAIHFLYGNGSSASAEGYTSQGNWNTYNTMAGANAASNIFGAVVIDVLDYANTSKNKVMRSLGGNDRNGGGEIALASSVWLQTSAITSLTLKNATGVNWSEYTQFALYGVKGN